MSVGAACGIFQATMLSRSSLLHGIATTAASSIVPPVQQAELDLSTAAELINTQCPPEFLRAVARSRRFLYRGEGLPQPRVLSPAPDLLQLETYGSQAALDYFMCLETTLAAGALARPSTGHIGTSRRSDAEVWGAAASVWPINVGVSLAYAWPLQRRVFWPATPSLLAGARCGRSALRLDVGLERALTQGHEVLFAATSFVAVPAEQDAQLRAALRLRGGIARAAAATPVAAAGPCGVPVRRVAHALEAARAPGAGLSGGGDKQPPITLYTLEVDYEAQPGASDARVTWPVY